MSHFPNHLDAQIAAKVFGCAVLRYGEEPHARYECGCTLNDHGTRNPLQPGAKFLLLPAYSADLAAAGLVIDEMKRRGCVWTIGQQPHGWSADITSQKPSGGWHVRHAPTLAEAICRAALAALEA